MAILAYPPSTARGFLPAHIAMMREVFLAQIIPLNATTNSEVHSPQLALLVSDKCLQLFPIYVQSTQRPRRGLFVCLFVVLFFKTGLIT